METVDARILVVDDDPDILVAAKVVLRQRFRIVEGLRDPLQLQNRLAAEKYDLILLDLNFSLGRTSGREGLNLLRQILEVAPGQPVVVITAYGSIDIAVEAMKAGAADFVVKPWNNEKLEDAVAAALRRPRRENGDAVPADAPLMHDSSDEAMRALYSLVEKVAPTEASVLLLGETGTGKEELARYIHGKSERRQSSFVRVDLGAVQATLFESELFGHRRGAFTDAKEDRTGKLVLAHGGTLFLDEIANLPLPLQAKLLSALQQRQVVPVGSNVPVMTDFRLIAATNRDVGAMVRAGAFREDLLWRINTVEFRIPPLRERSADLDRLVPAFVEHYAVQYGRQVSLADDVVDHLRRYPWPGNIRELRNVVERAVILAEGDVLQRRDFVLKGEEAGTGDAQASIRFEEIERDAIDRVLRKHNGNMRQAALELGLSRSTLYRKVQRYGL